jgi:hypothetical protein
MASFEFLAIILTGLGLIISLLYYAIVISNQNKVMKTQILQRSLESLSTRDTNLDWWTVQYLEWEDYDDFRAKYGPEVDMETWSIINTVWNEMNGIGYLVYKGIIDIESVYDYGGGRPTHMYRKFKPYFDESQRRNGFNRFMWWEYLYSEMRKISDKRGDTFFGIKLLEQENE